MNIRECDREPDVLEAVISGAWPPGNIVDIVDLAAPGDPGDNDLRAHASRCPVCADLAAVALVLQAERDAAWREARVPTSGQVWWRATMRRRAEATAAAARPISLLQGLAGACAAGVCAAVIALAWPATGRPFEGIAAALSEEGLRLGAAAMSAMLMNQALLSLAVVIGAGLILSPFLLYLALSDE